MKPEPLDPVLYAKVRKEADKSFAVSSAYKSGWIVKTYKDRGGAYASSMGSERVKTGDSGLTRWFKEKWVDLNRPTGNGSFEPCGRKQDSNSTKYPLCRPSIKVNQGTPRTVGSLSSASIAKAKKDKAKVKGTGHIKFQVK